MNVRDIGGALGAYGGGRKVLRAGRSADAARTGFQWQRGLCEELNTCT